MAFYHVPHPAVVFSKIRVNDIWFLLAIGAVYELGCRLYVLFLVKMKPNALLKKEHDLKQLTIRTNNARKLGPSAFVETSKLERQVLSFEKELNSIYEHRKRISDQVEKQLLRYGNMQLAFLIFFLYYGVPIVSLQSSPVDFAFGTSSTFFDPGMFLNRILFPITYVGMGVKLSRWGMSSPEEAACSIGALAVMWSAQVTMGQIMDALDAYYL